MMQWRRKSSEIYRRPSEKLIMVKQPFGLALKNLLAKIKKSLGMEA
jgi:hypothetical protein